MADDGPELLRPIPRRPFGFNLTSATPPEDDESPTSSFQRDMSAQRLWTSGIASLAEANNSLSRPQSFTNLTSSTLMGIYSPTATSHDRIYDEREETDTPWGTGARTPAKRPSVDQATYELMRDRAHLQRRRSSFKTADAPVHRTSSTIVTALSLALRGALLFLLGVGYGVVVSRFHKDHRVSSSLAGAAAGTIIVSNYDWKFMVFWGVSGVVLGALLPWFDGFWEASFGSENNNGAVDDEKEAEDECDAGTDWALAMRAVGAFVGIAYAIRKVSWASTLQLSLTLALVNPLLWWLIDRSKSGLLLSGVVGLSGSLVLLGVGPEMMPAPSTVAMRNDSLGWPPPALALGGFASQETIETGVWMMSVLFCSCVCFGNIGRRLAWSKTAGVKGRWAGLR